MAGRYFNDCHRSNKNARVRNTRKDLRFLFCLQFRRKSRIDEISEILFLLISIIEFFFPIRKCIDHITIKTSHIVLLNSLALIDSESCDSPILNRNLNCISLHYNAIGLFIIISGTIHPYMIKMLFDKQSFFSRSYMLYSQFPNFQKW